MIVKIHFNFNIDYIACDFKKQLYWDVIHMPYTLPTVCMMLGNKPKKTK